jgi:serine/threonine-protein kinase RsbT
VTIGISDLVVPIENEDSIIVARQSARALAQSIGFSALDQSRIATGVSELARNVVRYATNSRGEVRMRALVQAKPGIEIVVHDEGPGIADLEQALAAGFTSGRGLGMGLPGTRRLMDEMEIDSAAGRGTTVTIRKWKR